MRQHAAGLVEIHTTVVAVVRMLGRFRFLMWLVLLMMRRTRRTVPMHYARAAEQAKAKGHHARLKECGRSHSRKRLNFNSGDETPWFNGRFIYKNR